MEVSMQAARPIRGPHGGWQKQEIDALRQSIEAAEQSGDGGVHHFFRNRRPRPF